MAEREVIPALKSAKHIDRQTSLSAVVDDKGISGALANHAPLIIAEWPKNAREIVRVDLHEFNRVNVIATRVWYRDGEDVKPTRSGLTLSVKHLPALAQALNDALSEAIKLGLVEGRTDQ